MQLPKKIRIKQPVSARQAFIQVWCVADEGNRIGIQESRCDSCMYSTLEIIDLPDQFEFECGEAVREKKVEEIRIDSSEFVK